MELQEKYRQKARFNQQYYWCMVQCKKQNQWIMYQEMCPYNTVRNVVLENSAVCIREMIADCDVDAWVKGSGRVSKMPDSMGGTSGRLPAWGGRNALLNVKVASSRTREKCFSSQQRW